MRGYLDIGIGRGLERGVDVRNLGAEAPDGHDHLLGVVRQLACSRATSQLSRPVSSRSALVAQLRFVLFRKSGRRFALWWHAVVYSSGVDQRNDPCGRAAQRAWVGGMQIGRAGSHSSVRAGCLAVRTRLPQPGERSWI